MGHPYGLHAIAVTGLVAIAIAGCGSTPKTTSSAFGGGSSASTTSSSGNSALTFRYPSCQITDNDWDVTAAALGQAGTDATYDKTAGTDAGVLAADLRQLSSEASSANETSTALIYQTAATLFEGDAAILPVTGQTPVDNGGYINAAGTQLQADCSLQSFQPSNSIDGPATSTGAPSQSPSSTSPAATSTTSAGASTCESSYGVHVAPGTTCPLGVTVYDLYASQLDYDATNVPSVVTATSSDMQHTYTLHCAEGASQMVSCTDRGIVVSFQQPQACNADHAASARCATAAKPYCGTGLCNYNPPADSCAAGWSYHPPQPDGVTAPGYCTKPGP
jgi:hypothetical protein